MAKSTKIKNRSMKPKQNTKTKNSTVEEGKIKLKETQEMKSISKKAKRLQKKSTFIAKLSASNEAKAELKRAKRRARTVIVGDMNPLLDALTDITVTTTLTTPDNHQSLNVASQKKKKPSLKTRKKSDLKDIELFKRVTAHPKFTSKPIDAIADHVKYLIQLQDSQKE